MAVQDAAVLLVGLLLLFHTWGAWANVEVNMEDRVEVFRGKTAQITCMFNSSEGIGALIIQWYYVTRAGDKKRIFYQDSTSKFVDRGMQFTDRISVNGTGANGEVVLTINNVQLEDEVEFICLVKSLTEAAGEGRTQLKVFEIPELPVIEGVQTGISVNEDRPSKIGTCEVKNGFPKPTIIWYRSNTPLYSVQDEVEVSSSITYESSGLLSVKSELRMKVVKEDKDNEFYCEVNYVVPGETRMTESKRINITVYYPSTAVNIWVESPKGKIKEGDQIELHCRGDGNMPSSVISIKHENDQEVTDTDMLVLNNVTRLNNGVYECTSLDTDTFNTISGSTTVFVNYLDPASVNPDLIDVDQGKELNATCNALSSLQTHTAWFKNGKQVVEDHHLMQKDASFDMSGTYECVVTVPEIEGMETRGTLVVHVHGPPDIIEPDNMEMEETTDNMVDLSCTVRGYPTPSISWTTSDGNVLKTDSLRETEKGFESVVKIKVTSDITAFCNASNDYGNASVTFKIKATIHTITPATSATSTTATSTSTRATTFSSATVKAETDIPPKKIKKEGSGVIIAVIIVCILLLAILGSVLYFLYKKGKICGRYGKQDLTKEKSNKDNIVVEMKNDNTEEAVLLGVNGEKRPPDDKRARKGETDYWSMVNMVHGKKLHDNDMYLSNETQNPPHDN